MRTPGSSRPQSSASGRGRSRYRVSTRPTEPGAAFEPDVVITRIIAPTARSVAAGSSPGVAAALYDPAFVPVGGNKRETAVWKGATMAESKVNNGVNVGALLEARAALKDAPAAAKFTWRASCKWQNGTHSNTQIQGFHGLGQEQKHKTEFTF